MTCASDRIRALALSFPSTYEDSPWGFPVFKVGDNKLFAMMLPWVRHASYVGRYGWITARITDEESLQTALEWMRESYWLRAPVEFRDAVVDTVDDDAR